MTHTEEAGGMSCGRWCQLCNCLWFQLIDDRKVINQQLQNHMNIYKLPCPQSASPGCGTQQTLHTFILSRLLIMGERHTSCDWILSLTQGCSDSPASPSSISQNKLRGISSQMNTEKREREREKQNQEHCVRWINDIITSNKFLLALGAWGYFTVLWSLVSRMQTCSSEAFPPGWGCWPGWITRGF